MKKLRENNFKELKKIYYDNDKTNEQNFNNEYTIDFDLFCLINWFLVKDLKEGESFGYVSNNLVMVNSCIQNYIRTYAGKLIDYDLKNKENIGGLFILQDYCPTTLKNICFAFLGMEESYTDELIEKIKKSYFWKDLSKKQKIKFNKDLNKIKNESILIKNENLELHKENINIKKQRGTINQYFNEWESNIINVPKGKRKTFYNNEFIINHPELSNHPYEKFINKSL